MTKRVLIAEDEDSITASLEFLMRRCGYETRCVRDGHEAVRSLADFRPDLVLLDLMLPGRSGFDVCQVIREDARFAAMRVLMLTARSGALDVKRGLQAGADVYLTKPFATRELVSRVRELLEGETKAAP
jgi:DNA-binding response OmpR family regulator